MHWRRKWQPTPVLLPGESQGQGAWWAAIYGVAQSQIRLKRPSSSSINWQAWAFVLPPKEEFWTLLGLFTTLSLSVNHVYTTETLGKELGKEEKIKNKKHCTKGLLIKTLLICLFIGTNVKPNKKNQCLWLIIQLLIGDPMVCGYLTAQMILTTLCVIWKVTDTMMEHYYDKRLLEWLDRGLAPPPPKIVLDKQSGSEQWAIWKLAASIRAPKNLELGPDIS